MLKTLRGLLLLLTMSCTNTSNTGGSSTCDPSNDCPDDVAASPVLPVDKVDILFVVGDSGSMLEEQEALRAELPNLMRQLSYSGSDLHLGVTSPDMGLVGIQGIPRCESLGHDGLLLNIPDPGIPGCGGAYPLFISFDPDVDDLESTAADFSCMASLGTEGCGFQQHLEAGLKALWPSTDMDPETGAQIQPNRILFLGDINGAGQLGHGDLENAGFLRNDPAAGISLIAIIIVSDEEDCSSADTRHFTPKIYLDPNDPLAGQDLNLRCFFNPQNLYSLDRYANGFKALRPGAEQLVIFGAIVGVPTDLVSSQARTNVDFTDENQLNTYYDGILNDPRMVETPDPNRTAEQGGKLTPSCITDNGPAYPPRRIVEMARKFGPGGMIQSICQESFGTAINAFADLIGSRLR